MNSREQAFAILQRVELEDAYAAPLLDHVEPFTRALVLGVIRWRAKLDAVIERAAARPAKKIDQRVLQILRIGAYQLLDMDVAAHAAVNESVDLAARHAGRARGFVNAVLRKIAALDRNAAGEGLGDPERLSHPAWLLSRWSTAFGRERAMAIAAANQELSHPDIFVNTERISREALQKRLAEREIASEPSPLLPDFLRLRGGTAEIAAELEEGLAWPMDEGSAVIASLARGPRVLDMTAAPGGKSLVLRHRGHHVVSNDISIARLLPLRRSHIRLFGEAARVAVSDGRRPPFLPRFDSILLDAPCSATGTIRKNPEVKWRLDAACFAGFASLQLDLLRAALDLGPSECIYATCSLEPEENDAVVEQVLAKRNDYEPFDLAQRAPDSVREWVTNGRLRLTPENGTDGFTAIGLRRRD